MFLNNVGHYPNLKLLKMDSEEAYKLFEPKSIDMVFIDADHDYESVKRDIENWMPISKKIIFGHDYHLPEIQKVLIEKFISDKESDISLKNRYFYFLLDDEKKEELPMIFKQLVHYFVCLQALLLNPKRTTTRTFYTRKRILRNRQLDRTSTSRGC